MLFYESKSTDPYYNLALEEFFFEKMDKNESYFILWQNENTVVVGKYQNTAEEINSQYVEANKINVVRRLSGGGAVYHDLGNLNFTFITDQKDLYSSNFSVFVVPVINALKKLGINAEFTGRNDITIDGMKISGNSQYSKKGRVMHHGCIMLDTDLSIVSKVLRVKEAKFESKAVKSVRSRVTTINRNAPCYISMDRFKSVLKEEIFSNGDLREAELSEEQRQDIKALKDSRYATWEWNYGKSPKYNMRKEKKFPSGLVTVLLAVKGGMIEDIHFYGDFFGNGEISDLEDRIKGHNMDGNLKEILETIEIEKYMMGISGDDIYKLLMY